MSFRELRNFTEYLRCLGYPRLVSADNFRTPNFDLVAELLFWMVDKYDPTAAIPDDISTEDLRVDFLTSVAQVMWSKANLKLNTKRLYSADGKAVKELIKVAHILYKAVDAAEAPEDPLPQEMPAQAFTDSKSTRALASQITEQGARLYDLLEDEKSLGAERQNALRFLETISGNLSSNAEYQLVESRLEEAIASASEEAATLQRQCEELESDKKTLRLKIQKKQGELERNDKRLKSLQSVRPAFMDEYEKLERELEVYYDLYLQKFRNLDYLQTQLDLYNKRERLKLEENEKTKRKIQRSIIEDNQRSLRPEQESYYPQDRQLRPEDDKDRDREENNRVTAANGRTSPLQRRSRDNSGGSSASDGSGSQFSDSGSESLSDDIIDDDESGSLTDDNSSNHHLEEDSESDDDF